MASSLNNEVLDSLICPSCDNYMADLIYECVKGHSMCHVCSEKAHRCPVCESVIYNTRNFALERISNLVSFPCHLGCKMYFKQKELQSHLLVCSHRMYQCRLDENCKWEGQQSEILTHSLQEHDDRVVMGSKALRVWNDASLDHSVLLMVAYESQFYVHRVLKDGIMYWTVQYLGKSQDIILYYYTIHLYTDEFKHRSITFSEMCQDDVNDEVDELLESGYCVAVPLSVLETFKNSQKVVFHDISIEEA